MISRIPPKSHLSDSAVEKMYAKCGRCIFPHPGSNVFKGWNRSLRGSSSYDSTRFAKSKFISGRCPTTLGLTTDHSKILRQGTTLIGTFVGPYNPRCSSLIPPCNRFTASYLIPTHGNTLNLRRAVKQLQGSSTLKRKVTLAGQNPGSRTVPTCTSCECEANYP